MFLFGKIWRVLFFLKHPSWDSPFCLITDDFWQNKVISSCCECYGHNLGNEYFGDFFFFFFAFWKRCLVLDMRTQWFSIRQLYLIFDCLLLGKFPIITNGIAGLPPNQGNRKNEKWMTKKQVKITELNVPIPDKAKKLSQIFIFTLLCGALKAFIKAFEAPQRSVKIKI